MATAGLSMLSPTYISLQREMGNEVVVAFIRVALQYLPFTLKPRKFSVGLSEAGI
jgi:hypothetical protein